MRTLLDVLFVWIPCLLIVGWLAAVIFEDTLEGPRKTLAQFLEWKKTQR
jgi:hypothetical protein